ncbi:mitochondrial S-adenosylmethionine carrier protein isoform X2 [Takifugu rubripes]|uniref:mitochondrial S-adenosylmethionine carrier protein isoform X2 n=1 Tax=Takifugu rubripes TaxID=31033 RepID=UPI001145F8E4|nr:S-adenosylmethionine mitochondrial carrier protein isoform X2 [Takifugu rubripes]
MIVVEHQTCCKVTHFPPVQLDRDVDMERREFVASLVAGGCAGMCVDLTLFPLDTIKTRLQSQQGFYKAGGFRGIYAGVPSAAVGSFPNAAAFFVTYDCTKSLLGAGGPLAAPHVAPVAHMLAASLGEIVACLIRVPTEVVKQRTQASPSSTSYQMLVTTLREEGVRGLYRGYASTALRETLWSWKQGHTLDSWQAAVCGAFAGAVAAFVTTPLDVAKTRIMLAKAGTTTAGGNIPLVLYDVWKSRGLTGLFAGSIPRVTFISLGGFIFLGAYEKARRTLL